MLLAVTSACVVEEQIVLVDSAGNEQVVSPQSAGFGSQSPPIEAEIANYVAARAEYQRAFDAAWTSDINRAMQIDREWVREYGPRLRRIVSTPKIPGLVDSARMHIGSMSGTWENKALPDGFLYQTSDRMALFVTDTTLFHAWALQARSNTGDIAAILRDESVFTDIFETGAGAQLYGRVGPTSNTKRVHGAYLLDYAQDDCTSDCGPTRLAVAVGSGRYIFVAQQWIPKPARFDGRTLHTLAQSLVDRIP
jgi:hypothetical protein